ncbi:glycerophosphoryl diester phosphodiesterase [Bacilli bacterium PM5-3]|nr:glycerophosphoryl diester phosphodiesterase [Bacilli bacterium PM5-3]
MRKNILVQSFNKKSLLWIKNKTKKIETILLVNDRYNDDIHLKLNNLHYIDSVSYNINYINDYHIAKARKYNKKMYLYVINTNDKFIYATKKRVNGIFTDFTKNAKDYFSN